MTKREFLDQLDALTPEQVARVLPFLEADLAAVDDLMALKQSIDQGRRSAASAPLQEASEVYRRVRKAL